MYDGSKLDGPVSVRQAVLNRSAAFLGNFAENLLAYAVGRVLDHNDMPAVRSVAREAAKNNNRLSSFVAAVVSPIVTGPVICWTPSDETHASLASPAALHVTSFG